MLEHLFAHTPRPAHDAPCLFKCTDFTTEIVGRFDAANDQFYVERGDGTRYSYGFGVAWFKELSVKQPA